MVNKSFDHSDQRASSLKFPRVRAQLRKNKNKYIFIQVGPNSEQKYHAIYQTTGKLGHGIHFRCQI